MITEIIVPKKWVGKGREFAGEFKIFGISQGIQISPTMRDINAAFAERTIPSTKCSSPLHERL